MKSSEVIRTLDEIKSSSISNIHTALVKAKKIYFLGFGYGENNLKLLNIKNIINKSFKNMGKYIEVHGTAYRFSEPNRKKILRHFNDINLGDGNTDCNQFLSDYGF